MLVRIPPGRLAEILDIVEDGIITIDGKQEIVVFSRGAAKLFGYSPDEVIGRPLSLLLPERFRKAHPRQVDEFRTSPDQSRAMGTRREVAGRRKDGSEFPAEISISKFVAGGSMLFTAIVRNVSERKRFEAAELELERLRAKARVADAEAAARETETQYRRIVETANEGIWQLDENGKVAFINRRMAEMLGYPIGEIRGRFKWDFVFDEDRDALMAIFERRRSGVSEQVDVRFRRCDGKTLWTLMAAQPVISEEGTFLGSLDMFTDITARRLAEESVRETTRQLWQAARLAGVGELAASIAHELNNPLGTIALRLDQIVAKTPEDDPRRRSLNIVVQEVERMGNLVGNLLQFSRAGRDQVSTVDVAAEVMNTIELVGNHLRKRRIQIEPQFEPNLPLIQADRHHLRQVFLNLFTNAADAMPDGGKLMPRVRSAVFPDDRPAVVVEVKDTGVGIPPEFLQRVAEPFFTTKEEGKGTGLGLAICRRIVEQHHGRLEIESQQNVGTIVRVTLPVRSETNVAGLRSAFTGHNDGPRE